MSLIQAIGVALYMAGHGTRGLTNGNPIGSILMIVGGILVGVGALV